MNLKTIMLAASVAAIATTAVAHKGATGVLLERMQGMLALGEAIKAVTPMMRGQEAYDPARTTAFADVLRTHSGETMLALFPEGLNAAPSAAKDNVWTDWEEFEGLAMELALYAEALDQAAGNGIGSAAPAASSMLGGDTSSMMGGDASSMMGGVVEPSRSMEELALLPANVLFTEAAQTCASCHTKFRAEE